MAEPRWLPDGTADSVRAALATVAPELADGSIDVLPWVDNLEEWHRNSAIIDGRWVVKFAWSEAAADKIEREIAVLLAVEAGRPRTRLRHVRRWSTRPVLLVALFVPGAPLEYASVAQLTTGDKRSLADDLAAVLAELHDPDTRTHLGAWAERLPSPTPQAGTEALRTRLCPRLDTSRRHRVRGWCDWVDSTLAEEAEAVVLHGDFHGHNLVVDPACRVRCVLDLEEASLGDYHYDFRYLPAQEPTLDLFLHVVGGYEARTGRRVATERVMAWHVRTTMGDALWRVEAGVALPDGRTVEQWVDDLAARLHRTVAIARGSAHPEG